MPPLIAALPHNLWKVSMDTKVKMVPHPYAEQIHAWADGAKIERRPINRHHTADDAWRLDPNPSWFSGYEWRVHVPPPEQFVKFLDVVDWGRTYSYGEDRRTAVGATVNDEAKVLNYGRSVLRLKLTFEGEAGALKIVKQEIVDAPAPAAELPKSKPATGLTTAEIDKATAAAGLARKKEEPWPFHDSKVKTDVAKAHQEVSAKANGTTATPAGSAPSQPVATVAATVSAHAGGVDYEAGLPKLPTHRSIYGREYE